MKQLFQHQVGWLLFLPLPCYKIVFHLITCISAFESCILNVSQGLRVKRFPLPFNEKKCLNTTLTLQCSRSFDKVNKIFLVSHFMRNKWFLLPASTRKTSNYWLVKIEDLRTSRLRGYKVHIGINASFIKMEA